MTDRAHQLFATAESDFRSGAVYFTYYVVAGNEITCTAGLAGFYHLAQLCLSVQKRGLAF